MLNRREDEERQAVSPLEAMTTRFFQEEIRTGPVSLGKSDFFLFLIVAIMVIIFFAKIVIKKGND